MAKPERTFKAGAVRASVFLNTMEKNGQQIPIRKVVLEVRYKDKSGEWKSSTSFSLNEIPKAMTVLRQAYEYLLEQNNAPMSDGFSPGGEGSGEARSYSSGLRTGFSAHRSGSASGAGGGTSGGPRLIGTYQG